ncbi:MAG TPA: carbohydrate-binding protein [Clostridia bacterium]
MTQNNQNYLGNGVAISKLPVYVGDEVTITYDGLLLKSGADKIYAYVGYGDEWNEKGFIPMNYEFDAFKTTFKVISDGTLNVAFKDSADNWDNNSLENYKFEVSKKSKTSVKAASDTAKEIENDTLAVKEESPVKETKTRKKTAKSDEKKEEKPLAKSRTKKASSAAEDKKDAVEAAPKRKVRAKKED